MAQVRHSPALKRTAAPPLSFALDCTMKRKGNQFVDIRDVLSLDASAGSVGVDIGYLGGEDHMNAFVGIFEKFVHDNKSTLGSYETISIMAKKPIGPFVASLAGPGGISLLFSNAREVGKELYNSNNEKVRLLLSGKGNTKELVVFFDNPHFSFI